MTDHDRLQSEKIIIHADPDIQDMIPSFLENRKKDLAQFERDLPERRFDEIRSVAHKIKGNSAGYGFQKLSEIGAELEDAARSKSIERVQNLLNDMADYLKRVEVIYGE